MNPTIKEQQKLMQDALKSLSDIDTVNDLIGPVDPIVTKMMVHDLQAKYTEIMMKLQMNMLKMNTAVLC